MARSPLTPHPARRSLRGSELRARWRARVSLRGALLALAALVLAGIAPLTLPSREARGPRSGSARSPLGTAEGYALQPAQLALSASPVDQPRMRRWEPLAWQTVGVDPNAFARLMTFIFVESGGYQFAVSRTACVGLMQFCSRTALRPPFDTIFDIERLRRCRCRGRCRVPWRARRFLETQPRALHPIVAAEFPCSLTDPRFDPEQAIRAGWAYIDRLSACFEGNIYLAYIGYNSGADVSHTIWRALGPEKARSLPEIGRVLRRALAPKFRRRARRRARALLRVHLPKIARIYRLYQQVAARSFFRAEPASCTAPQRRGPG